MREWALAGEKFIRAWRCIRRSPSADEAETQGEVTTFVFPAGLSSTRGIFINMRPEEIKQSI
jgi:hypothetical protein